jgi:Phosphotransferase enzyme family
MKLLHYTIIRHFEESQILLIHTEHGWTLPCYELPLRVNFEAQAINQAVMEQFKARVIILRQIFRHYDQTTQEISKVHVMENHEREWFLPDYAKWFSLDELKQLNLYMPQHLPLIENYLTELKNHDVSPLRPLWAYEGWYWNAHAWIVPRMMERQLALLALPEQLRTWVVSSLLRIKTTEGNYYLKASNPHYGNEAVITQLLVQHFPANLPRIGEFNLEQNALLMLDMGNTLLEEIEDISLWEEALRQYARLQLESQNLVADLIAIGCKDRRFEALEKQIENLFQDKSGLQLGVEGGLSEEEYKRLQNLLPIIKAKLAELQTYNLPYTLEHGDFHDRNFMIQNEKIIFFDWSDANVGHPFFSLYFFIDYGNPFGAESDLSDWKERFRDAYLSVWSDYGTKEHLNQAFEIIRQLSPLLILLQHAEMYRSTEDNNKWQFSGGIISYARKVLSNFS